MSEVVVIGAGMGGLAAAIDLAAEGKKVTVFEAAREAGGKVGRACVDGIEFDTGPSVMTMAHVLHDLLRDAGFTPEEELELVRHDHAFDYLWPDGTRFAVHFDVEETLVSAGETFGPRARDELASFLGYARGIWEAASPAFVHGDAPSFGTAMSLGVRALASLRKIDPMRTMQEGIARYVKQPHLREVLARYATYNGSDPRVAPATLNCIAHVELVEGSWGIRGGMYELARVLERAASALGVEFRYEEPVREICTADASVTGIRTDRGSYSAEFVVANADVAHVFSDLLPRDARGDYEPSMSGWTAVVRAERAPRAPHTVLFPTDYDAEFVDVFDRHRPPIEPTVYLCAQEKAHLRQGWNHQEPVFVMANAPAEGRDGPGPESQARFERLERTVLARIRRHGLIGSNDSIVWKRTPSQLASSFPGSRGSIYGAASNSRFAAFQRPANLCGSPRGLALASGSVHPGGGVPLCLLSGRAAARAYPGQTGR